jgi:hypothetical protein
VIRRNQKNRKNLRLKNAFEQKKTTARAKNGDREKQAIRANPVQKKALFARTEGAWMF